MKKYKNLFSVEKIGKIGKFGKKNIRGICVALVLAMGVSLAMPAMTGSAKSYLDGITSDSIKEKEKEVAEAKKEKEELLGKKSDLIGIKAELETQKANLAAYIAELDAAIAQMEYNIMDLEDQIYLKEAEIAETEEELEQAKADEQARYDAMVVRMRLMYERNNASIISSLLGATSLRDLLNRMDYIESVVSYDKKAYEELQLARKYVELCEEELQVEKENLDDTLAAVEEEKANIEALVEEKNKQLTEYMTKIAQEQQEIDKTIALIDDADDEIALLEEAILAEKKAIYDAEHTTKTYDGGSFILPIASYTRVSSEYGYRIHPIYGTTKFHSGVDLAAPKGTAIYAAYNGTVASAGYNASMGNYVMINHGDGLFTIYMHASKLCCSEGDVVATGQKIAEVGTTGASTGNHLHFSVRLNGSYVDPNNYYPFY